MDNKSNTIRYLRKSHGLSQEELGRKMSVGKTTISNWETGYSSPDSESLLKMSEIFQCSVDFILGNAEKTKDTEMQQIASEVLEIAKRLDITEIKALKSILDGGYTIADLKNALITLEQFAQLKKKQLED